MKVLHIAPSLRRGGAEGMMVRLASKMNDKAGAEVVVVTLFDRGHYLEALQGLNVRVECVQLTSILRIPAALLSLILIIRNFRPDAVFTWMYHADLIGGLASKICRVKNIFWGVRCVASGRRSSGGADWLVRLCVGISNFVPEKIICCGHAAAQYHLDLGYPAEKMVVIHNGYEFSGQPIGDARSLRHGRAIAREKIGLEHSYLMVGMVGRDDPLKDLPNFLSATAAINTALPDTRFVLVGQGFKESDSTISKFLAGCEYRDRFHIYGPTDPDPFYNAMDVFCLSSRSEGFPNVLVEAMASGTYCVSTNVGDAQIILGRYGACVPPEDSISLGNAIISALEMPEESRLDIAIKGSETVRERFHIDAICALFFGLIMESE